MKIILTKAVKNIGQIGDIKNVAEGFARNFLIPQGLAIQATDDAINNLEKSKSKKDKTQVNKVKKYKDLAKKINNHKISIKAKADDKKTLFAAIKAEHICEQLKLRKFDIPVAFIKLKEPIKQLGYYDIKIEFAPGVEALIGLTIERES